jgi:hypothetical protein
MDSSFNKVTNQLPLTSYVYGTAAIKWGGQDWENAAKPMHEVPPSALQALSRDDSGEQTIPSRLFAAPILAALSFREHDASIRV